MKINSILAAVLIVTAGRAYAADFAELQPMKVSDVKAATAEVAVPAVMAAAGATSLMDPAKVAAPSSQIKLDPSKISPALLRGLQLHDKYDVVISLRRDISPADKEDFMFFLSMSVHGAVTVDEAAKRVFVREISGGNIAMLSLRAAVQFIEQTGVTKGAALASTFSKVENPKYVCQTQGGGHAIAINGNSARVWQIDGIGEGAAEGLELVNVVMTRYARPDQFDITGNLAVYGQIVKIKLTLVPDAQNRPYMSVNINGHDQQAPLNKVPCRIVY